MARYRCVGFDEIASHTDAIHIAADGPLASPIDLGGGTVYDTPNDLVVIEEAVVVGVGVIWKDAWIYDDICYAPKDWREQTWLPGEYDAPTHSIDIPNVAPTVAPGDYLFLDTINGHRAFGDFVHDTLPYCSILDKALQHFPDTRALAARFKFPNFRWLADVVMQSRVVEYHHPGYFENSSDLILPFRVDRLILARRQADMSDRTPAIWHLPFQGLRSARSRILSRTIEPTTEPLKVYIHRRDSQQELDQLASLNRLQGRDYANIPELATALLNRGYIGIEPGFSPIESLLPTLASTNRIVGLHGAGLCHFLFCREDVKVFEIRSANGNWRSIEAVAAACGIEFIPVWQKPAEAGERAQVDAEALLSLVG